MTYHCLIHSYPHSLRPLCSSSLTMAAKAAIRYAVVDAFTDKPFKGNQAVVCFLPDDEERDVEWMKSVVMEFNLPMTVFLSHDTTSAVDDPEKTRFRLRWFTPAREVDLCGHGTMAAAHFLHTSGISNSDAVEFISRSGHLTAKIIPGLKNYGTSRLSEDGSEENSFIELDFPAVPVIEIESPEVPSFPKTLKGANVVNVCKTAIDGDLIVELASGQDVVNIQPDFDEIQNCPTRAIIITGAAPHGSEFDFFSRVFAPKLGINEDQVTGSVYCALAPYWSNKFGKPDLVAYQASPRGGRLELHWNEHSERVHIAGEAITIMLGTLLA